MASAVAAGRVTRQQRHLQRHAVSSSQPTQISASRATPPSSSQSHCGDAASSGCVEKIAGSKRPAEHALQSGPGVSARKARRTTIGRAIKPRKILVFDCTPIYTSVGEFSFEEYRAIESGQLTRNNVRFDPARKRQVTPENRAFAFVDLAISADGEEIQFEEYRSRTTAVGGADAIVVEPFFKGHRDTLLAALDPPLDSYPGFYKPDTVGPPNPPSKGSKMTVKYTLGTMSLKVARMIEQGGYAKVYLATLENSKRGDPAYAVKIQAPPTSWEFYISSKLQERLSDEEQTLVVRTHSCTLFRDKSVILMDYNNCGSLQDAINAYLKTNKKMEEPVIMYYTIEMLRIIEACHKCGIIHTDIKPDNFMLYFTRDRLKSSWTPERQNGWEHRGLQIIDFGCSIDQRMYPPGTKFRGTGHASTFDCLEMREGKPWDYQPDLYGLCATVHCMLQGDYMKLQEEKTDDGRTIWMPKLPLRRYWQRDLWDNLFRNLINIDADNMPNLRDLRRSFENYLVANPSKASMIASKAFSIPKQ
ncbi:mitotic checkpoint serine/threonine-protein kinase BUB1 [Pelomyxa schiedti]|nr:mitotic checkpoint serine/threonine-protein kinase BUB1 [Pelomyxa schiedti]